MNFNVIIQWFKDSVTGAFSFLMSIFDATGGFTFFITMFFILLLTRLVFLPLYGSSIGGLSDVVRKSSNKDKKEE